MPGDAKRKLSARLLHGLVVESGEVYVRQEILNPGKTGAKFLLPVAGFGDFRFYGHAGTGYH